ncbi:hypothetical protein EYC84_006662 [Monilinia fructicola]|uniref:Uncharacterized protein n=1 Tax=Monilinia fructicola TaxID=38448 RepID=A0A5M9K427_MONFR|nr:hypothetical protein EYC84_006662 [Monilinia fructicola]
MATVESSPASGSNRPPRQRTRRPRRGGHRNAGPAPADSNADTNLNANVTPDAAAQASNGPIAVGQARPVPLPGTDSSNLSNSRNANTNNRGSQGRRGDGRRGGLGRGGRRGGPRGQTMTNGRVFGGQLTSNSHSGPASDAGSLAGDAPSFVPGQHIATRPGFHRAPRARRMSKSQAPDLATRTHEDITNGQYECIQNTRADGAVDKFVMMYFLAENIAVNEAVMRASVAAAKFLLNLHATVVKLKKLYLARSAMKSAKVKHQPIYLEVKIQPYGHGLALSIVVLSAADLMIAVNQIIISVGALSNVGTTLAQNFATRALVDHAVKLSLMKLAVLVAVPFCNHQCPAAQSPLNAVLIVQDKEPVVIHRPSINVTSILNHVRNVRSL